MKRIGEPLPASGYQVVRDNGTWTDHVLRTVTTAAAIAWLKPSTIADPACGDASIAIAAHKLHRFHFAHLNDISEPQIEHLRQEPAPFGRNLECSEAGQFLLRLPTGIDLIVMTEFLEHVEDPRAYLGIARKRAKMLVASSPIDEDARINNHEHVWSFSLEDYQSILLETGWLPMACQQIQLPGFPYRFQIWSCQ